MSSAFVWHPTATTGRSLIMRFRRSFTMEEGDRVAPLKLFADSRYRLWLDGTFVTHGPARFTPDRPEYDTIDLASLLTPGRHTLAIEALHRDELCFQAISGPSALWVDGSIASPTGRTIDLGTPGKWICSPSTARSPVAPAYSFAISSVEILDARQEDPAWMTQPEEELQDWQPATVIDASRWGKLRPRSIPTPSFEPERATSTVLLSPTAADETVFSAGAHLSSVGNQPLAGQTALICWIHADKEREIAVGAVGTQYALNGQPLEPRPKEDGIAGMLVRKNQNNGDKNRGSRRDFDLTLNPGWNLLCGLVPFLRTSWVAQLGFPREVCVRCEPHHDAKAGFQICFDPATVESFQNDWPSNDASIPAQNWTPVSENHAEQIPSLRSAWELPSKPTAADAPLAEINLPLNDDGSAILVQDFKRSCVGHVLLDVTAPAGTVIDIAIDERRNDAGTVPLYRAHPANHMADRYVCREGRQVYEGYHPRGGRFLQLNLRHASGPVTVHRLALRDRQGPVDSQASFSSSDPLLDIIWDLCRTSLLESLDDSWVDGWREHGIYLGDSAVQAPGGTVLNFDQTSAYIRRTLQLFLSCQTEDGQMLPCVPSEFKTWHPDFTLLWGIILHDYWQRSGDLTTIRSLWVGIERIHKSAYWKADDDGLWALQPAAADAERRGTPFIDWGVCQACRWGKANLAMNALRLRFLKAASDMARALARSEQADAFDAERSAVAQAMQNQLWDEGEGRYADYLDDDGQKAFEPCAHGNVFALLASLPNETQRERVLEFLKERCQANREVALQGSEFNGQMELYFCHYALEALGSNGEAEIAEKLIHDMWDLHFEHDAQTTWEALCRGAVWGVGSVCHSWSVGPLNYITRHTLGAQWDFAREPGVIRVRPLPGTLQRATGTISLPGSARLTISWSRRPDGTLDISTHLEGADYKVIVEPRRRTSSPVSSKAPDRASS